MVRKRTKSSAEKMKRFTVSLEASEYEKLRALADGHRPRLSLQYVVRYAIHLLLAKAEDPQFMFHLGNPIDDKENHGST